MQQAFPEHLLSAQPWDQHLEKDMNELHPWPPGAHSPARKNSHVNGSLEYPVVSAKNRGVSPVGWGHMCQNDSPCMVGRVGSKCLSELIVHGEPSATYEKERWAGGEDTWGLMPALLSDPETHLLWAPRSPSESEWAPKDGVGDHWKWFKVVLILIHRPRRVFIAQFPFHPPHCIKEQISILVPVCL